MVGSRTPWLTCPAHRIAAPNLSCMSAKNVEHWTRANADFTDDEARRAWAEHEVSWGLWPVPEAELGLLGDVAGLDVVELGCGTAFGTARLARLGARVVGVDPTPAQLGTARQLHRQP